MSGLHPATWRKTDTHGRVGFLPGVVDDAGRLVRYVPLAMPHARALACARRMAGNPALGADPSETGAQGPQTGTQEPR